VTAKAPKESRLDRIEKDLILFLESMVELRESQKETDELFRRTDEKFLELRESQKKTEEQLRRTDEKLDRIGTQLADLGLVQGEVAEDLFY
jgi:septation ring formation regulator EzrA